MTLDRYGHLFPSLGEGLADSLDEVMRVAAAGRMRDGDGTKAVAHIGQSAETAL